MADGTVNRNKAKVHNFLCQNNFRYCGFIDKALKLKFKILLV